MILRINTAFILALAMVATAYVGCAGPQSPISPQLGSSAVTQAGSHTCLGLWEFAIDPVRGDLTCVPLRSSQTHMNALFFLEPPAGVRLKVENVALLSANEISADIAIVHPFAGANYTAAFDVCGILISHGTYHFPISDKLFIAGDDQVHLINPDGYTRWWNPVDFPPDAGNATQGYIDGLLGKPQSEEKFDSTLNGYKYFASDLKTPDADLSELDMSKRGAFVPGTTAKRRYQIGFTTGNLKFNYAIDANWAPPVGPKPINVPDSFPESANRPEAYRIEIHNMANTLHYDSATSTASGDLAMSVYVFDWFGAGDSTVCGYAQNEVLFGGCNPFPVGGDSTYSIYEVELTPMNMNSTDDVMLWIEVSCPTMGYQGKFPFEREAAYFRQMIPVSGK